MTVTQLIMSDEGYRQKPYLDCCGKYWRECTCEKKGKLTGGYGRNLDDVGLSKAESAELTQNDVYRIKMVLTTLFHWFEPLSDARQAVVISMAYNLGVSKLCTFKDTLDALSRGDFPTAGDAMLKSGWAAQVGDRAKRLAKIMITGEFLSEES